MKVSQLVQFLEANQVDLKITPASAVEGNHSVQFHMIRKITNEHLKFEMSMPMLEHAAQAVKEDPVNEMAILTELFTSMVKELKK